MIRIYQTLFIVIWWIINGTTGNNFRYADDAVLIAESLGDLKNHVMQIKNETLEYRWEINIRKAKIMAVAVGIEEQKPYININGNGNTEKQVADFIYL